MRRDSGDKKPATPVPIWTGGDLRAAFFAATIWFEHHAASINALNVFPVPDGDTGTNMALTLRAAVRELDDPATAALTAGEVAARVEYGALMGARGNSGVILSQLLRGFARTLHGREHFDGLLLAEALQAASATAYKAVIKPVEGTMLTVGRAAGEGARQAARRQNEVPTVLAAAVEAARAAVARTPEQLPILAQAGVVDAGGQGVAVLLEGFHRHAIGELTDRPPTTLEVVTGLDLTAVHAHTPDDYGYCTNFLISGVAMPYEAIRDHLAATGHSVVIVGDERLIKVHLHTLNPGAALEYAIQHGALSQIKIDNMDEQRADFAAKQAAAPTPPVAASPAGAIGLVAVASGDGFARVMRSLGADAVVAGGQTMNPSASDLLAAIEALPRAAMTTLPLLGSTITAARQAAELSARVVEIVPTRTMPQGIAALLAYSPERDVAANAEAMRAAAAEVRTGEVTRAVRDVTLDGVAVQAGETIALLDDVVVASSPDPEAALAALLAAMGAEAAELITCYLGQAIDAAARARIEALVAAAYPAPTLEVIEGGQPHYDLIVTVE